jgi:hypothetical protein
MGHKGEIVHVSKHYIMNDVLGSGGTAKVSNGLNGSR